MIYITFPSGPDYGYQPVESLLSFMSFPDAESSAMYQIPVIIQKSEHCFLIPSA